MKNLDIRMSYKIFLVIVVMAFFLGIVGFFEFVAIKELSRNMKIIYIIVLSIVFGFIAIFATIRFTKIITQPINEMVRQVEQVASGNLTALRDYVPIDTTDELGRLSRSFYHMANTLKTYVQEIITVNEELLEVAYQDALTGLPNRRYFVERLNKLFSEKKNTTPGTLIY